MTRRLLGLSVGIGTLALLAVACGGSDATATPDLTAERAKAEYLGKVTAINARFDEAFRGVEETLTTAWPTRGRLLSVLSEIDIGGVFEGAVADLKALTPPPDYQADHQRYFEFREQIVPFMAAQDQAIDDGDLVSLALARMNEALLRQHAGGHFLRLLPGDNRPKPYGGGLRQRRAGPRRRLRGPASCRPSRLLQ